MRISKETVLKNAPLVVENKGNLETEKLVSISIQDSTSVTIKNLNAQKRETTQKKQNSKKKTKTTADLASINSILKNKKNAQRLLNLEGLSIRLEKQEKRTKALNLEGLSIRLEKQEIWVSGDTYKNKDVLKDIGFTWLKWKKCWVYGNSFKPLKPILNAGSPGLGRRR